LCFFFVCVPLFSGLFASGQLLNFFAFICHNFSIAALPHESGCVFMCICVRGGRGHASSSPQIHFGACCALAFLIYFRNNNKLHFSSGFPLMRVCVCVCSFAKLFYVAVACLWLFDIIWIKKINPGHGWTAILIFSLHPSSGKQTLIFILFLFSPVVLRANQSFNLWNG